MQLLSVFLIILTATAIACFIMNDIAFFSYYNSLFATSLLAE